MKLSFTTLGCPDWSFEKVMDEAQKMGFSGIEIRGVNGVMNAYEIPEFKPENKEATLKALADHNLEMCGFGTSINFHDPEKYDAMIELGKKEIDVCSFMGIPKMRVFGDKIPDPEKEQETIELVAKGIGELADYAADKNVTVLLEVHGQFNTIPRVKGVCDIIGDKPAFGVLWDIEHSDKIYEDNWVEFYEAVKPWIKHTHFKDHKRNNGEFQLTRLGEGDIPIAEIAQRLQKDNFDGYYSLEWEKKWHPELPSAEVAYPDFMRIMTEAQIKKIRVAIVGYGRSGRNIHTKLLKLIPDKFQIVMYADGDAERRQMIADEMKVPVFESHTAFYDHKDEIDLVINASFSKDHSPISKDLMEHGFDVLQEKPAATDLAEFESALEVMKRTGRKYYIFQQYRFAPSYQNVKKVIASGVLGRIVQANLYYDGFARRWDWQTVHTMAAGSLHNTGPHPMDHAMDLMGFPEEFDVFCAMDCAHTFGDGEDYVKLLIRAKDAPIIDIEISACNAYSDYTYLIQGTNGTLKGGTKRLEWTYYVEEEAPEEKLIVEPLRDEKGIPIYCRENLVKHTEEWVATGLDADDFTAKGLAFYNAFYETLTEGKPFMVTLDQVQKQMKLMTEAYRQNEALFNK